MPEEVAVTSFPVSKPYVSELVRKTVQLPSRTFGLFKKSTRKPINDKGYLFSILVDSNPEIGGGMNSGDVMLAGGRDRYIQLCVGSVVTNGARGWGGGAIRQQKDANYYGLNSAEQEVLDANKFATEHNKDLCFGGINKSRGVLSAAPTVAGGISTVTFAAASGGSFYLADMIGRGFFFHHPTTFAEHGETDDSPYPLIDCPTKTTARFTGTATGDTTAAALDIVVPAGTGDGVSSVNRGIRNLEYFCEDTGDYFTGNRDAEPKIRGTQYDLAGDEVTRAILEYMDGLFTFRWPDVAEGTKMHTDLFSPSQRAKMLFQAEGPWRLTDAEYKNFDPKNDFRGWGGRKYHTDVHIKDSDWFTIPMDAACYYAQKEWGPWNYDSLDVRSIPSNSSIRDALQKHYIAVDQVGHEEPGKCLQIQNCSTVGVATKTS